MSTTLIEAIRPASAPGQQLAPPTVPRSRCQRAPAGPAASGRGAVAAPPPADARLPARSPPASPSRCSRAAALPVRAASRRRAAARCAAAARDVTAASQQLDVRVAHRIARGGARRIDQDPLERPPVPEGHRRAQVADHRVGGASQPLEVLVDQPDALGAHIEGRQVELRRPPRAGGRSSHRGPRSHPARAFRAQAAAAPR